MVRRLALNWLPILYIPSLPKPLRARPPRHRTESARCESGYECTGAFEPLDEESLNALAANNVTPGHGVMQETVTRECLPHHTPRGRAAREYRGDQVANRTGRIWHGARESAP